MGCVFIIYRIYRQTIFSPRYKQLDRVNLRRWAARVHRGGWGMLAAVGQVQFQRTWHEEHGLTESTHWQLPAWQTATRPTPLPPPSRDVNQWISCRPDFITFKRMEGRGGVCILVDRLCRWPTPNLLTSRSMSSYGHKGLLREPWARGRERKLLLQYGSKIRTRGGTGPFLLFVFPTWLREGTSGCVPILIPRYWQYTVYVIHLSKPNNVKKINSFVTISLLKRYETSCTTKSNSFYEHFHFGITSTSSLEQIKTSHIKIGPKQAVFRFPGRNSKRFQGKKLAT